MIRTVLRFQLKPDAAEGFVEAFRRFGILEASLAIPGCRSAEIAILHGGREAIATATWDGPESYQGWIDSPERDVGRDVLDSFLVDPQADSSVGGVYEIRHAPMP